MGPGLSTIKAGLSAGREPAAVRWVSAAEVEAALDHPSLIAAVRAAFLDPPSAPRRFSLAIDPETPEAGTLLVMPALRAASLIVVKLVTIHPRLAERAGGALRSTVMVLDAASGEIKGLVDGHALTNRRTAAASVVAARALARPDSRRLVLIGAGGVARALAEAYASAFALQGIAIWARRPKAAETLGAELRCIGLPAQATPDRDAAVAEADIVSAATLSQAPLVFSAAVRDGTHVDLVGGFKPDMREADDALMARARVVADGPAALDEAGDLVQPIACGVLARGAVRMLDEVLRAPAPVREPDSVTVFKSVGLALEDLAAAELLFARLDGGCGVQRVESAA